MMFTYRPYAATIIFISPASPRAKISSNCIRPSHCSDKTWSHGNFDCVGNIQFPDFLILSSNFGQSNQVAASVPEPAALSLVGYGLLVAIAFRRKRPIR